MKLSLGVLKHALRNKDVAKILEIAKYYQWKWMRDWNIYDKVIFSKWFNTFIFYQGGGRDLIRVLEKFRSLVWNIW